MAIATGRGRRAEWWRCAALTAMLQHGLWAELARAHHHRQGVERERPGDVGRGRGPVSAVAPHRVWPGEVLCPRRAAVVADPLRHEVVPINRDSGGERCGVQDTEIKKEGTPGCRCSTPRCGRRRTHRGSRCEIETTAKRVHDVSKYSFCFFWGGMGMGWWVNGWVNGLRRSKVLKYHSTQREVSTLWISLGRK